MMKEWKRLSKKGKAVLIALTLGGALCGASSVEAAVLAVTIPSDYANSELGYVTGSRVTDYCDYQSSYVSTVSNETSCFWHYPSFIYYLCNTI